jgi:hypothetical protein
VALVLLLAGSPTALGANARGSAVDNLKQIVLAMQLHQEQMGRLPTDILDREGRPLLSWRVQLLPFLEQDGLFRRFRLDEAWDSPHNRQLIAEIPRVYLDPVTGREPTTRYLQPRGDDTVFLCDRPWLALGMPADLGAKILVVEVDDDHTVVWTRPKDLDYDPANPRAGLARRWMNNLWRDKGALVALSGGEVRLVWSQTNPDFLHARISATLAEPTTGLPTLLETAFRSPFNELTVPFLLISLTAVAGSVRVVYRLLRKRACSPGEFLCLIVGAANLVLLCLFPVYFQLEQAPFAYSTSAGEWPELWVAPRLAGLFVSVLGVAWYRSSIAWRSLFGGLAFCFVVAILGASVRKPWEYTEEALITGALPLALGLAGIVSIFITRYQGRHPDSMARGWAHWTGIVVSLMPLVFCVVWWLEGRIDPLPPNPLYRIRD